MSALWTDFTLTAGNSLWFSTLVKVTLTCAGGLIATRVARRSRASVRHLVLALSFTLLVVLPLVSLLAPPLHIAIPIQSPTAPASTAIAAYDVPVAAGTYQPGVSNAFSLRPQETRWRTTLPSWPSLFFALWLVGAAVVMTRVIAGIAQISSLRRSAIPWRSCQTLVDEVANDAGIHRHVSVLIHESIRGPMTCGVMRPAVLLPTDARSWPTDELKRALVHEIEHIRRGDWISRCAARAICGIYWFHPLVWMSWHRFVLEAERACDDAVFQRGEPTAYADQLVDLAQRLRAVPAEPILGMATRHDLAQRVSALLDQQQRRGPAGVLWIVLACAASALLVIAMAPLHIVAAEQASASQADNAKFDVATVKPCKEEDFQVGNQRRQEFTTSPGRMVINCIALDRITFFAYAGIGNMNHPLLNDHGKDHVRGGPSWVHTDHFVVEAKAEGVTDRFVLMGPMLRNLLEDKFKLKVHREIEEANLYAMTVAKGGLKIKPIAPDGCRSFDEVKDMDPRDIVALDRGPRPVCGNFTALGDGVNRTWSLGGETLERFANQTLSSVLDRFVMDRTGIGGLFNIQLKFVMDDSIATGVFGGRGVRSPDNPVPDGIEKEANIFTALEEQLGLKLEKTRGPHEYLVIESAERPSGF